MYLNQEGTQSLLYMFLFVVFNLIAHKFGLVKYDSLPRFFRGICRFPRLSGLNISHYGPKDIDSYE